MRRLVLALVLCGVVAPATADRRCRHKPGPPVTVAATAVRSATGWQVVVEAAPSRDVAAITVEVDGRAIELGATKARASRRLAVPVALRGDGRDVVVTTRVAGRSQATIVRIGAPAPAPIPPSITTRWIGGIEIAEVRE